jgi:hypothetical protein
VDRSYPYPALFIPTGRGLSGLVFIGVAGCGRASALSFRVWGPEVSNGDLGKSALGIV